MKHFTVFLEAVVLYLAVVAVLSMTVAVIGLVSKAGSLDTQGGYYEKES